MKNWLVFILFIGVCLFPLRTQAEYDLSAYFPLDQGDTWVYKTVYSGEEDAGTYEERVWIDGVGAINGQDTLKMFTKIERPGFIKGDRWDYLGMDSEGVKLYLYQGYRQVDPPALIFPAQIEIGGTVESSYTIIRHGLTGLKHRVRKITLEGVEDISIKAGEFKDCLNFSIETVETLDDGRKAIENSEILLAPDVGVIKEIRSKKFFENDGTTREKNIEKELKGALVRGVNVGEEVKVEVGKEEMFDIEETLKFLKTLEEQGMLEGQ